MIKTISNFKFCLSFLIIFFLIFTNIAKAKNEFIALGANDAPIKIKIFSSLSCPHCANFHINVLPEIKKKYVDANKVQLIFIDFPLDQASFNASKMLHCLDEKNQINFLDKIYENQNQWTSGSTIDEINNNLKKIANIFGIDSEKFSRCINDENVGDKILNARINGQKKYSIKATPTIIINEKKLEGDASYENIKKKIEKLI